MPQGRVIALVIAATGVGYVLVQLIGASFGLSNRTLAFFDFVALGIFAWALVNAYMLWRKRRD